MNGWTGTAKSAIVGFGVAWIGTFLINLLRSPVLIEREYNQTTASLKADVAALKTRLEPLLLLGINLSDESCVRTWPGDPFHKLFRVRVENAGGATVHNVGLTIKSISPQNTDVSGRQLFIRHGGISTVDLRSREPEYFDILEYNHQDHRLKEPVLFVWYRDSLANKLARSILPTVSHEIVIAAYGDETSAKYLNISFTLKSPTEFSIEAEFAIAPY